MKPIMLYDILTLDNNKRYTVTNLVLYKGVTYLYLVLVDSNLDAVLDDKIIVKRVIKDSHEAIEKVVDSAEYKEVAKLFFDLFKDTTL